MTLYACKTTWKSWCVSTQDGLEHWSALDRDAAVPYRQDFDPSELPPALLPHIVMMEVSADPLDFRYRVVGDHVLQHLSCNPTGTWMSESVHHGRSSKLFKTFTTAVRTRKPQRSGVLLTDPGKDYLSNEEIILPLCGADDGISRLLVFVQCLWREVEETKSVS